MKEIPGFTIDDVQREAHQILLAIDASRDQRQLFEDNWRRLWQLLREANAAYLPVDGKSGPWHVIKDGPHLEALTATLAADGFSLPMWPPESARLGTRLFHFLNWARVPVP